LGILYNLDLTTEPRLERVRDMFIFGCYTGLRFSDFSKVKRQYINLADGRINMPTQKTGEDVALPILPIAKSIIAKYKDKTPNSLPPSIANQTFNRYIKEIAMRIPELNEEISFEYYTQGKKISRTFKKWEKVSSHTARRSFATNLTLMEYPTQIIMKITGHRTEASFQTYLKMSNVEAINIINRDWESRLKIGS
jgi:integrase